MDSSWAAFSGEPSGSRQQRYATNVLQQGSSSAQHPRDLNPQQPPQLTTMVGGPAGPAGGVTTQQQPYQAYHGTSATGTLPAVTSPTTRLDNNSDYNMDVQMQDADPYNRAKYQQAQSSRQPYLGSEESSASQRYSPMNTSVSSQQAPFTSPPTAQQANYSQMPVYQSRQSPSRPNYSSGSQSYYSQTTAGSPRTSAPPSMQSYQHPLQQQQSASGFCAQTLVHCLCYIDI